MSLYDDALAQARHRFVGRDDERARFRSVLESGEPRVWWLFGPGGIGKSRLLSVLADEAVALGRTVVVADLREGDVSPRELMSSILERIASRPAGSGGPVVVLDPVEPTADFERWFRRELLPGLPSGSVLLVGSRPPPGAGWRSDPASSALLDLVPLRGLSTDDGRLLLTQSGLPPELTGRAMALGRGHPLALRMLAELWSAEPERAVADDLDGVLDLVAALLGRLVENVPDDRHRSAIELASLSRMTTRSLLRDAVDHERADELFDWLAAQPWIDRLPGGLCPHDLARDVIETDLRNNDPDRYARARRALCGHLFDPVRVGRDPYRCVTDYIYLHRTISMLRDAWDWSTFGVSETGEVRDDDVPALAQLVAATYGEANVAVLEHWIKRQPASVTVLRSLDEVVGVTVLLVLDEPGADDLDADPTLAVVWDRLLRRRPLRPGERFGLSRFVCDREAGSLPPSPTYNVATLTCTSHWLSTPGLAIDYVVKPAAGSFKPMMDYTDFHPVSDADHAVGGVEMVVFEHDWRESPQDRWLDRLEELGRGGPVVPATDTAPVLVALDERRFADAVRSAMRDLTRPDRLATNPLADSRVVRDGAGAGGAEAVAATVREAFDALEDDPRTERARRAVDRTYLRGAVTQEAAAEVLGMAFSTYRRHLGVGVDLLIGRLWRWELYGRE